MHINGCFIKNIAERVGFEPTVPLLVHELSKLARSATLTPLQFNLGLVIILYQFQARSATLQRSPSDRHLSNLLGLIIFFSTNCWLASLTTTSPMLALTFQKGCKSIKIL